MKVYLHYTIWNKGAHVPWICEGIRTSMPTNTILDFVLDHCTDATERNLELASIDIQYGGLSKFKKKVYHGNKKYRWPNTNDAIKRFMASDCDVFLSPQDDQQIKDKHLFKNLERLLKEDNVGLIGMRDGIDNGQYYSSNFSNGTEKTEWLVAGDYRKVVHVNDGPIALTKKTVEKVGYFDEQYWVHYTDTDYSFRCNQAGLQNYVLGAEIVHEKWSCKVCGEVQPSEVWSDEFSKHDYDIYRKKWLI